MASEDDTKTKPGSEPDTANEGRQEDAAAVASTPHSWFSIALGFGVVLAGALVGAVLAIDFFQSRTLNLVRATEVLERELEDALDRGNVPRQFINAHPPERREDAKARWNFYLVDFEAPPALSLDGVEKLIRRDMEQKHVAISGSLTDRSMDGLSLQIASREFALVRATQAAAAASEKVYIPPATAPAPVLAPPRPEDPPALDMIPDELPLDSVNLDESALGQGHVPPGAPQGDLSQPRGAIILDDGGYGGAATEEVFKLDTKLTLAILPNTPHATETAERAEKAGFEVMLHMPMEALSAKDNFPGYISADMRAEQMRALIDAALGQIPGAAGINNHTGSKFTASEPAMKAFIEGLKDRPLYFVDSHTTSGSVAYTVAKESGVKAAANNIFLDNKSDAAAIRAQFEKFVNLCKTQGHAIAIGHFRPHTAAVLAEEIPKLAAEGITLVHVSELAK